MATSDGKESARALDDEDFFIIGGPEKCCTARKPPQTVICRALEIVSSVKVRTALRATTTRSIDCGRSPFCVNGGKTPQDSGSPPRRKCENSSKASRRTCIHCRTKWRARRISAVLHWRHPNTGPGLKETSAKEKFPSFQVRKARAKLFQKLL